MQEFQTFNRILRLLKGINIHPLYFAVPVVLSLCAAAFEGAGFGLLIPMLDGFLKGDYSFIVDNPILRTVFDLLPFGFPVRDRTLFGVLLSFLLVAFLLRNVLRYLSEVSLAFLAERANHHLRKVVFGRYLSFGKLYFDRTNVGHHSAVLTEFTRNTLRPLQTLDKHMNALFSLTVYFTIMLSISWRFTLFAIPLFVVLHVVVKKLIEWVRRLSRSIAERSSMMNRKTVEILSTIALTKAYSMENEEKRRYATISDEKSRFDYWSTSLQQLMLPTQEIITLLAGAGLFTAMYYVMMIQGEATAPSILIYFYLIVNASSKFGTLTSFRGTLANARGALEEMEKIFDESDKAYVHSGRQTFSGLTKKIAFRDLHFSYAESREVLKGISFEVEKGSLTAIVGPTGSGKSTLINLLMRYYDCPPGSLFIDGRDIREFELRSLLKHIALVSQETLLLHESLRYNLTYGLSGVTTEQMKDVIDRARLTQLVAALPQGLDTPIGDRGVKLSGGEKQRVAIARALLKGAEILILDEATSSLDSRTERLIQEAIDEAIVGRTAIVIAHRLSTIKHADKIVVISDGLSVEEGTLDELLASNGVFHTLWEEQKFI